MKQKSLIAIGVVLVLGIAFYFLFGLYSIQPIGAIPEGVTALVWRASDEPFFNSPDGRCLERTGSVSIICRMAALSAGPQERIVIRLPYMHWAYLASTDGREFDR